MLCLQANSPKNAPLDSAKPHPSRMRTGAVRWPMLLLLTTAAALAGWVAASGGGPGGGKPAVYPPEGKTLADCVQNAQKVTTDKSAWGSLCWLMNAKLDPQSSMTLGVVELNPGQSNPLHVHGNCDEIIYMLSGSGLHRVGNQTVVMKAGDVLRIPAGVPHSARAFDKEPMRSVVVYNSGNRQFTPVEEKDAK